MGGCPFLPHLAPLDGRQQEAGRRGRQLRRLKNCFFPFSLSLFMSLQCFSVDTNAHHFALSLSTLPGATKEEEPLW